MTVEAKPEYVLGILASGGGSNFMAIDDAIRDGRLPKAICNGQPPDVRVGVVLSDNPDAGALDIARERGIPAIYLGDVDNTQRNATIADAFQDAEVDMGIGAGYLKLVGRNVLEACEFDVLNMHPGPLYRFGGNGMHGLKVHRAVIEAGMKWSGPTVHVMDEIYDNGQILAHVQVPVRKGDTDKDLAKRVLPCEHDLFWRVIARQFKRGSHPSAGL